ncbi:MAG TPA: rod shape-determining protein RodA [Chitinophagales bacterium]|nr:rod shape-determining protein RodA [Chitinophagales bacterium]HMU98356.1 rod shape-determining protein RodA [Chitinophagales bacterium]HMW93262.1 rod shape-determining protein RodA [Chitinophagales bacterium]HMY42003.1 rod shape-determining protein RodA [Chitinophagales bacterium]HMZ93424.1 rod shape-determining protein RodA [Chitinophagales bacterium]
MKADYKKNSGSIDTILLLCYIALVVIGVLSIFSATYNNEFQGTFFSLSHSYMKQVLWAGISFLMFFALIGMDRRIIQFFSYPAYILIMLLLFSVLFIGERTKGDQNWINLGFFKLQPSEFAKFATAMALAAFFDTNNMHFKTTKDYLTAFAIIAIPLGLVLLQGDAGSAIVFLSFIFVLNREGLPDGLIYFGLYVVFIGILSLVLDKFIIIAITIFVFGIFIYINLRNKAMVKFLAIIMFGTMIFSSSVSIIFNNVLLKHQRDRINIVLGKELTKEAERGIAFNLNQSKIAIGSGGIIGKGYLNGTQTRFNYVPETSTDFIFTAIGEEWGFLGSLVLIGLYVSLLTRLIFMAEQQRTAYGRVYIYSVAAIIFTHVAINIGMTIGIVPVIGIPLPFISYGGSSLLSFSFMIATCLKLDNEQRGIMR